MDKIQRVTEWADIERYHLTPGIFQVANGRKKKDIDRLEVIREYKDTYIKIIGPYVLRPFDLVLLCSLVSMAGREKIYIPLQPVTDVGRNLRESLELQYASTEKNCLYCQTTMRGMCEHMGYKWGQNFKRHFEEALERIYGVSFIIKRTKDGKTRTDMSRLLSGVRTEDNKINFGLNPVLASALLGEGHYARLDMEILRELKSSQKIIYAMLCNACPPATLRAINVNEIRKMLYGDATPASRQARAAQTSRAIKQAVELCGRIGWTVTQSEKGVLNIKRPRVISA